MSLVFILCCRNENPIGTWTIRVSDQEDERESGNFLGWSMTLWGSSIDPEKAKPYVLVDTDEMPFPPPALPSATESVDSSLPSATSVAESGSNPISPSAIPATAVSTHAYVPSSSPQPSDWVSDGLEFVSDNSWTIGIVGIVLLFVIAGASVYLVRRRKRGVQYTRVSDGTSEDLRMVSADSAGAGGTVLYDADEEMALNGDRASVSVYSSAVGFSSGFLDDESPRPSADVREPMLPVSEQQERSKADTHDTDTSAHAA